MIYNVQIPPYLNGESFVFANGCTGREELKYTLLSIDKESYLSGVVENSDEYFVTVGIST